MRAKLKKQLQDIVMWSEEISLNMKLDDRPTGKFRAAKRDAEETIDLMNSLGTRAQNPYFGRIDFTFDSSIKHRFRGKKITFFIGKQSLLLKNSKITDWRTPIASIYYNFPKPTKNAFYKADNNIISGNLSCKHKIDIENATLQKVYDSSDISALVGSDPYLLKQLEKHSSTRLKDIISTIQSEQNAIISRDPDKDIIISGVAGSGKTSIAVHRLSWLLYNNKKLNPQQCLIVGPNALFLHYIQDILPETGSENVPQTTFQEWAYARLKGIITRENVQPSDTLSYKRSLLTHMSATEKLAQSLKKSRASPTLSTIASIYKKRFSIQTLTIDDLAPLVLLKTRLLGILPKEKVHYLVIDEVQDHTPSQILAMTQFADTGYRMVVGDIMQGIVNENGITAWDQLYDGIFKKEDTEFYTIRTSYRSTQEIIEYVNNILIKEGLPRNILPQPVLRHGPSPIIYNIIKLEEVLMKIPEIVRSESTQGRKNIAIIGPNEYISLFSKELTSLVSSLTIVNSGNDLYNGEPLISSIQLLKGLEFDAVIFVKTPKDISDDQRLKRFYTSCTRAMHTLHIINMES